MFLWTLRNYEIQKLVQFIIFFKLIQKDINELITKFIILLNHLLTCNNPWYSLISLYAFFFFFIIKDSDRFHIFFKLSLKHGFMFLHKIALETDLIVRSKLPIRFLIKYFLNRFFFTFNRSRELRFLFFLVGCSWHVNLQLWEKLKTAKIRESSYHFLYYF